MRITKRQLRRIIKEEKQKMLQEACPSAPSLNVSPSQKTFQSHANEPVIGDKVVNVNPGCMHRGSEGIVSDVLDLPHDAGKTITYVCTNSGPTWSAGDTLEKTMDQMAMYPYGPMDETKITKRQLRSIIKEAIAGVAVGPSKGSTFLDLTMRAIEDGDYRKAASYIMDSYMIDDIFPEDENNLMTALSSLPSARRTSADVEAVADEWLEGIRRADERAAEEILSTRMGSYRGTTLPGGKKIK